MVVETDVRSKEGAIARTERDRLGLGRNTEVRVTI